MLMRHRLERLFLAQALPGTLLNPASPHSFAFSRRQYGLLVFLTIVWGLNWPVMKLGVTDYPPLAFRALSMWLGLPVLWVVLRVQRVSFVIRRDDWPELARLSINNMIVWHILAILAAGAVRRDGRRSRLQRCRSSRRSTASPSSAAPTAPRRRIACAPSGRAAALALVRAIAASDRASACPPAAFWGSARSRCGAPRSPRRAGLDSVYPGVDVGHTVRQCGRARPRGCRTRSPRRGRYNAVLSRLRSRSG